MVFNITGRVETELSKEGFVCDNPSCKRPSEFLLRTRVRGEIIELGRYCSGCGGAKETALHRSEQALLDVLAVKLNKPVDQLTLDEIEPKIEPEVVTETKPDDLGGI